MSCRTAWGRHQKIWSCLCDLDVQNILDHDPFPTDKDQSALNIINFLQPAGGGDIRPAGLPFVWPETGQRHLGTAGNIVRQPLQLHVQKGLLIFGQFHFFICIPRRLLHGIFVAGQGSLSGKISYQKFCAILFNIKDLHSKIHDNLSVHFLKELKFIDAIKRDIQSRNSLN